MKKFTIILIGAFFVSIFSFSQQKQITLNLNNVTVKEALEALKKTGGYSYWFDAKDLNISQKVSINVVNKSIDEVLSLIFKGQKVEYKIKDGYIVINKLVEKETPIQKKNELRKVTGVVLDEKGLPVIGASVVISGSTIGVATDLNGRFMLEAGSNDKLRISYIGYDAKEILLGSNQDLKVTLEPTTKTLTEVVVTAQVRGQIKAIGKQLNSSEIMNAISAERIQELPDANAAETVARLPGVSLQRDGGEGSKLVIRGLEPKYNRISVEGVSMTSTGSDDRSVDISMISPFSLDGIEVTKAITADKDADYMGGSVNFKLRKAESGFKSGIIVQGGLNQLRNSLSNYMLVANIGNRFFKDKFGVYLQGNGERRNLSSNDLNASVGHFDGNPQVGENNVLTTGGMSLIDNYRKRNRYGATLVLDYKLPHGSIQFNNLFNQSITTNNGFQEIYTSGRTHEYVATDSENNLLTLTNVLDYSQKFGNFEIGVKVSHAFSNNNTPKAISFSYVQGGGLSGDAFLKPIAPEELLKYATINDLEANWTSVSNGSGISEQSQWESSINFKYDFEINNDIKGNFKGGFKYRDLTNFFDYDVYSGSMNLGSAMAERNAILNAFPWMQEIVPLGSSTLPYELFKKKSGVQDPFLNGQYTMQRHVDIDLMNQALGVLTEIALNQDGVSEAYHHNDMMSTTSDYRGTEALLAGYLMADVNLGKTIMIMPGVRFEENTTQYTAPRGNSSLPFPDFKYIRDETTVLKTDRFLLPMIHLKYTPVKWFNVRLAYTETLSRPNFNAITPRWDLGSQIIQWNNYNLQPEHSYNWDVYFSFFNSKLGLFTIGGFTKDIRNKIFAMDKRVILDPIDYGLPGETKDKFIYTQMNNPNTSTVKGLEVDWQTAFWYLPGAFKGLIFNVNYTWIHSEAKYPSTYVESTWDPDIFEYTYKNIDTYYNAPLVLQPKHILNLSFGYDYKKFSARISMLYKDKVFQGPNLWPELVNYSDAYVRWDMSVKQGLPWYGIQIFCNLNNITNAKDVLRNVGSKYTTTIQHYGSTIDFGLRFNLDEKKRAF